MGEGLGFGIVFSMTDAFSSVSSKIQSSFGDLQSVSESASAAINRSMSRIENGLAITGMGAALVAPLILATDKAMDFEAQLSSITAVAPELTSKMDAIKAATMQAGADTKYSALEAAQGFEELIKAGVSAEIVLAGGLTDALNLATAGEIAVKDAAEIASTALNAFKADNMSVADAGNILAGAANASATSVGELKFGLSAVSAVASGAGVSFRDTSTALAVLAQNGLKGSDAGTSLKTMLMNLSPATKEGAEQMKKLGIIAKDGSNAFYDSQGKVKGLADVSGVLKKALQNLNPKEQGEALRKMFGSDAIRAGNIFLKEGAQGFEAMQKAMSKVDMKTVADQRMNNLKGSIEQFKGNFETVLINIGLIITPILKKLVDFGTGMLQVFNSIAESKFGKYIVYVAGALGALLVGIGTALTLIGTFGLMWNTALPILNAVKVALLGVNVSLLPIIVTVAVVAGVVIALREAYLSFQDVLNGGKAENGFLGFMQKVGGVISGIMELFSTATLSGFEFSDSMYKAFEKIGIADFMVGIGTWFVRLKAIWEGVSQGLTIFYNVAIVPLVEGFGRLFSAFSPLFDIFGRLFGDDRMVKSTSNVNTWVDTVRTGFEVVAYAINFILLPIKFAIELIGVAISFVVNFGNAFINAFDSISGSIELWKEGWLTLPELFGNIGMAIVDNLKAGFLGTWESFKTAVANAVESLPLGIGGFLSNTFGLNQEVQQTTNVKSSGSALDSLGIPQRLGQQGADVNSLGLPERLGQQTKESRQSSYSFSPTNNIQVPTQQMPNLVVVMDGEAVGRIQEERNQFEGNRK